MAIFKDVYEEYGRPVYRFLLSLTGDEDIAGELLQETFYQAFLHFDRFEGRCSVYTWLCQIGRNAWYKECRRKKRFQEEDLEVMEDPRPSPEHTAVQKDMQERIRKAVYKLEEPYQSVFILRVYGEHRYADIGALHKKSENWARVTFYRAKSQVIKEVEG